ncbi:hypothetical protein Landi51_13962, partial [Colletotrichum acutatum]
MDLLINFIKFASFHCQPPDSNVRPAVAHQEDVIPAPFAAPVAIMMPDKYDRSFDRSLLVTMNEDADMAGELEHTLPSIYSITGHRRDADVETLFQLRIEGKDGRQA